VQRLGGGTGDTAALTDAQRLGVPSRWGWTYLRSMEVVVRVLQVLLALLAALVAVAFVMALGSSDTGLLEKVALLVLAALCVWASIAAPRLASRFHARRRLS
jgi:hypothetical protein